MATDTCYLYTFPQLFKLSQASSSQLLFQPSSPLALFLVLLLSKSIKDPELSFLAGALFFLLGLELQGKLFMQECMSYVCYLPLDRRLLGPARLVPVSAPAVRPAAAHSVLRAAEPGEGRPLVVLVTVLIPATATHRGHDVFIKYICDATHYPPEPEVCMRPESSHGR